MSVEAVAAMSVERAEPPAKRQRLEDRFDELLDRVGSLEIDNAALRARFY